MARSDDPEATRIAGRLRPDVGRLWARFYPAYSDHAFLDEVAASAGPDDVVLDIGARSGVGLQAHTPLKGVRRRLVGVDLLPAFSTIPSWTRRTSPTPPFFRSRTKPLT